MKKQRILSSILIFCLVCVQPSLIPGLVNHDKVEAAQTTCTTYEGSNVEAQNYVKWSKPVNSYLSECADGRLMRVQYGGNIGGILAEYYDASYNLQSSRVISMELPRFGAFYETGSHYFILTGQNNENESADVEVFRITKYDKNWNRLASAGLWDCNTTVPFDAGSARMDVNGNTLVVRTCHEMYRSADGYNHQANVRIEVDIPTMTVTDSYASVGNIDVGYVSHSFNQFVRIDNGRAVTLDHGDAYPRALVLRDSNNVQAEILQFNGAIGENATGAAAGALEISGTDYLAAGHSVVQDQSNLTRETRNVFVAAVPKGTSNVDINWLTAYGEGDGTTTTPQMVKINNDRFVVLWSREDQVYYTEVNGKGKAAGTTYSLEGHLSDCVPVVYNGQLVWYTWNNGTVTFYGINVNNLAQTHTEVRQNGHQYENTGIVDGNALLICSVCKEQKRVPVVTSMTVWWNESKGEGNYYSTFASRKETGDTLYYWISRITDGADKEMEVIVSNPEIVSCTAVSETRGKLTMLKPGKTTVTIRPKLNPSFYMTYEIRVRGIDDPQAEIDRIRAGIDVYSEAAVKSSDKNTIETLAGDMDTWKGVDYLLDNETEQLDQLITKKDRLLAKIAETADKIRRLTDSVNGYMSAKPESVKRNSVERTIAEIDALLKTENLTETERTSMTTLKTRCGSLLASMIKPGDINNDGTVNLLDLMSCLNHVSKKNILTGGAFMAADIDGNDVVNLLDLMRILNYVSKKSAEL